MRKALLICTLFMFLISLVLPSVVNAADLEWNLLWKIDGSLEEELTIKDGELKVNQKKWDTVDENEGHIYRRKISNWQYYLTLEDSLPLNIQEKKYIVYKHSTIMISAKENAILEQFNDRSKLEVKIVVPGTIKEHSGKQVKEDTVIWTFDDAQEFIKEGELLEVETWDGLLLGIYILCLGMIAVLIMFFKYMKKADRIIEEEYSLENIDIANIIDNKENNNRKTKD